MWKWKAGARARAGERVGCRGLKSPGLARVSFDENDRGVRLGDRRAEAAAIARDDHVAVPYKFPSPRHSACKLVVEQNIHAYLLDPELR